MTKENTLVMDPMVLLTCWDLYAFRQYDSLFLQYFFTAIQVIVPLEHSSNTDVQTRCVLFDAPLIAVRKCIVKSVPLEFFNVKFW